MAVAWRCDTEGTDPANKRELPTEAEALELAAQLVTLPGISHAVVWEMEDEHKAKKGPRTVRNAPLSDCEGSRGGSDVRGAANSSDRRNA